MIYKFEFLYPNRFELLYDLFFYEIIKINSLYQIEIIVYEFMPEILSCKNSPISSKSGKFLFSGEDRLSLFIEKL